jgi:hypothetical protein
MSDTMTYLTDATMITAVVPAGRADDLLKAARDVGARGGIVYQARGTGARELLGLLGIAVEGAGGSQYRRPNGLPGTGDQRDLPRGRAGQARRRLSLPHRAGKSGDLHPRGLHGPPAGGRLSG